VAEYMYSSYADVDESMNLFERIKSPQFKVDLGPDLQWAYGYPSASADTYLAMICYQKAADACKAGKASDKWVSKLRNLAVAEDSDTKDSPVYKVNDEALTLGTYLRQYGNVDDCAWKSCFRDYVIQSIDLLGDEDPLNDIDAYAQLVKVLLAAGDVRNASAAAAVVLIPESTTSDSDLRAPESINFSQNFYRCNGLCTAQFRTYKIEYKELHFCQECIDVCFCEECFPLIKKGELPYRMCSPDHKFIQLFPVPEDAKDVSAQFDGKSMEVQKEWLDGLRKDWS
jgi:hypothetical protein